MSSLSVPGEGLRVRCESRSIFLKTKGVETNRITHPTPSPPLELGGIRP